MSDLREILAGPTLDAARALLGAHLVRDDATGRRVGRIVEVEAYVGEADLASHARFGRTARNAVMYGPAGRAYVYLVYGMHDCLNIVTEPPGRPAAVLVRAIEPLEGIEAMRESRARRATERRRAAARPRVAASAGRRTPDVGMGSGPGIVCALFDLDRSLTGRDLLDPASSVRIEARPSEEPPPVVVAGPRVGIAYAGEPWTSMPWRFSIAGHPSVSRPLPGSGATPPDPPDDAPQHPG